VEGRRSAGPAHAEELLNPARWDGGNHTMNAMKFSKTHILGLATALTLAVPGAAFAASSAPSHSTKSVAAQSGNTKDTAKSEKKAEKNDKGEAKKEPKKSKTAPKKEEPKSNSNTAH
jgi:hypothetical protein